MGNLDDFLSLKPKGSLSGGAEGAVQEGLDSPLKPTTVGLKLIDAPNNLSNGLAYRINGSTLERISISDDGGDENSTSVTVVATCSLSHEGVHIKASPDGRMVAVACIDGSLQCFDSTAGGMSLRWSIANAHSHVSPSIHSTISKDRSKGACSSGPLLSLDFSPNDYILLLVDATNGVAIYDAKVSTPNNLVASQTQFLQNVSCASWRASTNAGTTMPFAIGKYDRTVTILEYTGDATEPLKIASDLGRVEEDPSEQDLSEENSFVCTHLNWSMETLIAGVCLVVPPDDDEEPESDDEDDLAEHEACLYVTTIDESFNRSSKWSEQGDVVPFFTVPKFGKHVFFTSVLCSEKQLIAVATNVGTDIGALSPSDDEEGEWNPVGFEEGAAATTPTNEDDEYVFPLGICLVQLPSSSFRLLLASTDGSISTFEYQHMNDEAFFSTPILGSVEDLPNEPLAIAAAPEPVEASSTPDNASWVVVDDANPTDSAEARTAVAAPETKQDKATPSASTPFSFGVSGSSPFGSGAKLSSSSPFGSSTFGSGTSKGLTFGSPSSSGESPFAAFSKQGSATASSSVFGTTSSLGGSSGFGKTSTFGSGAATPAFGSATTTPPKPATQPSTGFGSTTFGSSTFGSSTTPPGGGFAALSSNSTTGGFGSSTSSGVFGSSSGGFGSTSTDKSAFGSAKSPFKMFASPSNPSPASAFPTKPLFGSAPAPSPAAPVNDTTAESETVAPAATPETKPDAAPVPPNGTGELEESSDALLSNTEKTAAKVFDDFDTEKTKSLDISKFEDLSEALGEGFHGDEYDAQVALVDPSKSGKITRDNFIQWYKGLVEGSGDSDNESLDTADLEEREEERQKARNAFSPLSKTEGGKSYIEVDDFGKVIESMGSTYCEEEHRKTIKKLKKDGARIYESDFLEWYIDWLFGDEDSDDDDDDEEEEDSTGGEPASTDEGGEEKESLANMFKVDESLWKCEICSVKNKDSLNKCAACETPRPGFEDATSSAGGGGAPTFGGAAASSSSIGASGFSFGGSTAATSSSSIGAGGFAFGGSAPAPNAAPSSSIGASGFSFGGSSVKPDAAPSSSSIGTEGFSFGASTAKPDKTSSTSIGAGGFMFGGSTAKPDAAPSSGGFSIGSKTEAKASSKSTVTPGKTAKPDAAKSSSAAFPPMSAKAPTNPFGAKPAAKEKAPSSAAFPPMSAKAPTNPFGAKPAAKAPASNTKAAFPPMSTKAPTNPFGTKPAAKAPSSAAFPPMSAKAPTNPFGAKPAAKEKAPSSAAFPPMSAKAPTNPFGAKPAAKAPASNTKAAFPPMSAKAPTNPFGAKPAAKAPSSAAFPPMSAKAPTNPFGSKTTSTSPFGSFGAKSGETSTSKSPFSAFSAKPASSNPFGDFGSKSAGNAPVFGAKPSAKASSGSTPNAAFPPMSAKAPSNPFGAKPTAKAPASSTNAAFPPMSTKAPTNPFGTKPAAKASSSSNANAAFPPMSAKAPSNPFGAKSPAKASSSSNANTAFPPMSAKAPSNPFGAKPTAKTLASSVTSAAPLTPKTSSRSGGSSSQKSKSLDLVPKKKKSEMQIQLDSVISSFSSTVAKVSQMRAKVSMGDRKIREDIESYAIQTENERSKLLNLDDSLGKNRSETAFLLSRKTDATRQVDAASKMVQEIKLSNAEGVESIAGSQALDQESETQRRKFAASSRRVARKTALIEERAELLQQTLTDPSEQRHRCMLEGVLNLYHRSKGFEEVISRITSNVDQASRSVPHHARTKRSAGRSTYSLDSIEDSPFTPNRRQLKPLPIRIRSAKKPVKSKTSASHWKGIESSLQQLGNTSVRVNRFNTLSVGGNKDQTPRAENNVAKRNTSSRSLLMSPSRHPSPNVGQERALTLSTKINIFSPPSKTKARSGWDKPSTIDRNQMNKLAINAPQELKQTTLSNASRETLASFGTTPEKLRTAVDIKKNEAASVPTSVGSAKSKEGQLKRSTGVAAAFPPLSSKAPSNPFSSTKKVEIPKPVSSEKKATPKSAPSSAPLPPMPKKAPTNPFAKASASKPPLSQTQSKPAPSTKAPAFGSSEKASKKESPAPSTTFGNMKGLGDSLFSSGSSQKDEKQQPTFGSAPTSSASPDYKAILTSFYQKHNASRLGEVDKNLAKYKGREQEMFQKLAAKYKVPNPLQESSKPSSGFSSSSGFGNLGSTSSAPTAIPSSSGFGNTGSTMGASPFGSPSGASAQQTPAASTSPFGKPATNSTPFGKPATSTSPFGSSSSQSPFGAPTSQNTSTPFGSSSTPVASPFGNTASSTSTSTPFGSAAGGLASASPFGSTAAPTPFGAPSPSPMQQGSQRLFNGKSARDLLLQFYQEKNPSKVSEVDKLLAKYRGNEDLMFRNLAKKYQLNPSVFGVSAGAPAPSTGFGAASATPAFGQASAMGSGASPFGQSSGGFGSPSTFGGAPKPSGSTFGSSATSSFGSSGGFGSLAQSSAPSPFGGQSSGFGSPAPAFGGSSPFGAPRR